MTTPMAVGLIFAPPLSKAMRLASEIGWLTFGEESPAESFCTTMMRSFKPEKSGCTLSSELATSMSHRTSAQSGPVMESRFIADGLI